MLERDLAQRAGVGFIGKHTNLISRKFGNWIFLAEILTTLRNAFNNDDAYQAAMRQIAPRSPVTAIAGSMAGNSSPASTPVWFDKQFAPHGSKAHGAIREEFRLAKL